jgi:hypothetical protein
VTVVRSSAGTALHPKRHRPPPVTWKSMAVRKNTAAALENADLVRGRGRTLAELEEQPWKARAATPAAARLVRWPDALRCVCAAQRLSMADGKLVISLSTPGGAAADVQPPAPAWDYPRTPAEAIRYRVFADLHARGYGVACAVVCAATVTLQWRACSRCNAHASRAERRCRCQVHHDQRRQIWGRLPCVSG